MRIDRRIVGLLGLCAASGSPKYDKAATRWLGRPGRPIRHVARDLDIHHEALLTWVRQAEADTGGRGDLLSSDEREELERLRKENAKLKCANAILKDASVYFATELDPTQRK